ncbi:MAG: glycosyl hydrolase [Chthoniobacteraceae bacterium]|nr:glycosyl hydrolase [Chthoniobacteraceae bacterium]
MKNLSARLGSLLAVSLVALSLCPGIIAADAPPAAPKPFDHGDDPNVELFQYKDKKVVPDSNVQRPLAKLELKDKIYHGVLLNTDTQALFDARYKQYVEVAGAKPSMIGCFASRWSVGTEIPAESLRHRLKVIDSIPNVVPFIKLYTGDWKPGGPFMKADDILAGKEDAYFIELAEISRDFKKPFLFSINHEMNGDWFFFSELYKGQPTDWTAEKYKEVWRRIHRIFREHGATNVAFAWCPGAMGRKFGKYDATNGYKAYYPGDEYVDWVGASFYNDVNHYALDNLAMTYPNKPIVLAEWGTEPPRGAWYLPKPYPGDAEHMRRTFDFCLHRYPNMKAITYFYWGKDVDIERVPEQVEIYRREIVNPKFLNN